MGRQFMAVVVTAMAVAVTTPMVMAGQVQDGWMVPRTPDGPPDLRVIWASDSVTPLQRPEVLWAIGRP